MGSWGLVIGWTQREGPLSQSSPRRSGSFLYKHTLTSLHLRTMHARTYVRTHETDGHDDQRKRNNDGIQGGEAAPGLRLAELASRAVSRASEPRPKGREAARPRPRTTEHKDRLDASTFAKFRPSPPPLRSRSNKTAHELYFIFLLHLESQPASP